MTLKNFMELGFVLALAGAGAVYIAERGKRAEQLEQLKIQNEKLTELIEQLRLYRQERGTQKDV
jgi:hypothetical protein